MKAYCLRCKKLQSVLDVQVVRAPNEKGVYEDVYKGVCSVCASIVMKMAA